MNTVEGLMKVVSPYEELKSWFSLENYEQLKSLTIKELHTELAFREAIFDSVNFGWEDDNQNLRSILEGNPILSRQDNNHGHFGKGQRHVGKRSELCQTGFWASGRSCLVPSNSAISSRAEPPSILPPITTGSLL